MAFKNLPVVVIACQVLQDLLLALMPGEQITFMEYGLHETPQKLRETVQNAIDKIWRPSLVVLRYGLCGNGLDDIQAGKHHLLIPRADDCIALLLGSYQAYIEEFHAVPGTYLEKYRPLAQEVARYCAQWGMRYEERVGSDGYVQRLVQAARARRGRRGFRVGPARRRAAPERFFAPLMICHSLSVKAPALHGHVGYANRQQRLSGD